MQYTMKRTDLDEAIKREQEYETKTLKKEEDGVDMVAAAGKLKLEMLAVKEEMGKKLDRLGEQYEETTRQAEDLNTEAAVERGTWGRVVDCNATMRREVHTSGKDFYNTALLHVDDLTKQLVVQGVKMIDVHEQNSFLSKRYEEVQADVLEQKELVLEAEDRAKDAETMLAREVGTAQGDRNVHVERIMVLTAENKALKKKAKENAAAASIKALELTNKAGANDVLMQQLELAQARKQELHDESKGFERANEKLKDKVRDAEMELARVTTDLQGAQKIIDAFAGSVQAYSPSSQASLAMRTPPSVSSFRSPGSQAHVDSASAHVKLMDGPAS